MKRKKIPWRGMSLKRKVIIWFLVILAVMTVMLIGFAVISRTVVTEFDLLLRNNAACYEVQEAIEAEKKAFDEFIREASRENRSNYEKACAVTQQKILELPFDYKEIGEERYARTWNLLQGYEGYRELRDAVIQTEPEKEGYAEEVYCVRDMQENLSVYALRLVEATLEQNSRSYEEKAKAVEYLPWISLGLLIVSTLLVLYIMSLLGDTVIKPLLYMAQESRKIAKHDFSGEDLKVETTDEIGELTQAFNGMKHAMSEHIATLEALHREEMEKLELEKNLDHTRLEMLKSQVNPHFLFNTLNMISCMAKLEDAGTTSHMIISLSNLFRYNLRTKEQEVYLEQELGTLDDYIYIQQMRFDGRIQYQKKICVDAGRVKIPSFTLQPITENAFVHGLKTKEEGGRIVLRVWQRENDIVISVADNGKGMSREELLELDRKMQESEKTGKGIGLGNIQRRISMLYPDGKFAVYSKEGRGTVVQLTIPQKMQEEGENYEI
ncbi:MAG: histidine kinase [Fusicatenibacter sp.]